MGWSPWPSPTIAAYTARLFIFRTLAFAIGLVGILQTLDLLTESAKILAVEGNGNPELLLYVRLRLPQLISQFLPFAVLLGALVTMAGLSQHSEVVIFKAAGLSPHQILLPMMIAALGVSAAHFAFNETVLVRTNAKLETWQSAEYAHHIAQAPIPIGNVWERAGNDIIHINEVSGTGEATRLSGVRVDRRAGGRLVQMLTGDVAVREGDAWRLSNVKIFDVRAGTTRAVPSVLIGKGLEPARFALRMPDPTRTGFLELLRDIGEIESSGRNADSLRVSLYHKLSLPLSAVLMPLLGAVTAFGLARSGRLFIRSVIGMALGFAYFVADNFMVAMGQFGAAPPWLAAWAPFLLFFLVGEAVLFRTEE
jgi:lipopolysaccharide export system permease protein